MHLRWVVAVSLLCAAARPALADGALPTSEQWNRFLFLAATVVVGGIVVLILVIRLLISASRSRDAKAAEPAVPTARVVQDRDKP
ncbi:MAG TPA: hypothetical protein VFT22_13310 [Kofleriaceae bacterium]|nr:hypothetical protein [Kofleriaceae bacterium]